MIRTGHYSIKHLFIVTIFAGPAIAGFVMAMNLPADSYKKILKDEHFKN
jgi:hypothetical protein